LDNLSGASVFALVGLNESGKTTLLEAIHSFSPDEATSDLLGGDQRTGVPYALRVPRHQISTFTGKVSVTATLILTEEDKQNISTSLFRDHKLEIDTDELPMEVTFERSQQFRNGDFQQSGFELLTQVFVKNRKERRWREPKSDELALVREAIYQWTPDIAYFPSFVFDFPKSVLLTERGDVVDQFYKSVFQDILDYDAQGHTIDRDVIGRVRSKGFVAPWLTFLTKWQESDDREKIQHVMDRASSAVTRLVFGRWNKIFGEDTKGKEVVISYELSEGENVDANGRTTKTEEHAVSIKFQIRDGSRRYNVNDRSLGFRWFFAFMLFTQFRVARSLARPLLFLFDEPASNLHAAAQQKLVECFPEIARDNHLLMYSTHSHYMIEPKWLEQTFIVTNRADAPVGSILDDISLDDESLDIKVATYRSFVDKHPNQTSYFQPILDRLEVVPSRFDMQRASIVLEGKSDYYILRYASAVCDELDLPLIPALGAGTFGALAALHVGWNLKFLFVLDGDHQGDVERKRYAKEFGILESRLANISELLPGAFFIEDLFDDEALRSIQKELGIDGLPSKSQIRRFCQERLASGKIHKLSPRFGLNAKTILSALKSRIE